MAAVPHQTVGRWSYGEILWHLGTVMNCLFDGFPFQAPWWARKFLAPLMKKRFLRKSMPAGFKLPGDGMGLTANRTVSVDEGLTVLKSAVARFARENPEQPHPFLGRLTREEAIQLQLRHAELHLSFVKLPGEST